MVDRTWISRNNGTVLKKATTNEDGQRDREIIFSDGNLHILNRILIQQQSLSSLIYFQSVYPLSNLKQQKQMSITLQQMQFFDIQCII